MKASLSEGHCPPPADEMKTELHDAVVRQQWDQDENPSLLESYSKDNPNPRVYSQCPKLLLALKWQRPEPRETQWHTAALRTQPSLLRWANSTGSYRKGLDNDVEGAVFQARSLCLAKICSHHTPGHAHWKASSEATRRAAPGVFPWQDIVTNSLSKPGQFCHPILSQTFQNTHPLQVNQKNPP